MKTKHVCEICGFADPHIEAVQRCEWLGRHNHYRTGQEIVFLAKIGGEEWELTGRITEIVFTPQTHEPIYTVHVPEEPRPDPYERESTHFKTTEALIVRVIPESNLPTE